MSAASNTKLRYITALIEPPISLMMSTYYETKVVGYFA
jgi:hypothetical protein